MAVTVTLSTTPNLVRRLTATLFAAQSLASLGMTSSFTIASIAAAFLTGTTATAGVPTTLQVVGTALGAFIAGRFMERFGRRAGLTLGFGLGVLGAVLSAYAIFAFLPVFFFLAHGLMGLARGTLDQGRYAAGDIVTEEHRARTIGWVVLGGTVGGIGGPLFIGPASRFAESMGFDPLVGPFLASTLLFICGALMVYALLRPDPREIGRELARRAVVTTALDNTPPRTLRQALHEVPVQTAVAAMALAQVVMVTVMVMTPLQMTEHLHHTLDDVSLVIAAHVTGMYGTSVITGRVADRLGHARTILIGAVLFIVACVLAPFATETLRLAAALFVLGVGWNFCYVAGSSLLTDSLRPNERPRIQGTNDLLVGAIAALGSLGGGFVFAVVGYTGVALAGVTLAVLLFGVALWTGQRGRVRVETSL